MKDKKVGLIDRLINKKRCYHCGFEASELYIIDDHVLKGNQICVCKTCKTVFHGPRSRVNAYIVESDLDTTHPNTSVENFVMSIVNVDRNNICIDYADKSKNECNALNLCLFRTGKLDGTSASYFYVDSIRVFKTLNEMFNTIDTVCGRGCVFFSRIENIDTSTAHGFETIRVMKEVAEINKRHMVRNLQKARNVKKDIAEFGKSDDPIDAVVRLPKKTPIKKGETPPEFWSAVYEYRNSHITMREAAAMCNMSITTFRHRCKKYGFM